MKNKKRMMAAVSAAAMLLSLAGCAGQASSQSVASSAVQQASSAPEQQTEELIVFAAASLTESLNEIARQYKEVQPDVELVFNFDSSGTLKTQIQEGADCDVFLSAAQKAMNQLDITADASVNTERLDFVLEDTRCDLLQNKVVMIVPKGADSGISSFEDAASDKVELIALGNSDVPVGQYSQQIFESLGLWQSLNDEGKITFGTNVKDVTTQVAAAAVDCGVVYATDAASEPGVEIVCEAPKDSHKPVVYPAAVLKITKHEQQARDFLTYLQGAEAAAAFESVGFTVLTK